uniref:Uncharacterized protein n=1 Tax=Anopheles atroparvus TaxID=41427 RepID=A0A182IRT3_ANOAO
MRYDSSSISFLSRFSLSQPTPSPASTWLTRSPMVDLPTYVKSSIVFLLTPAACLDASSACFDASSAAFFAWSVSCKDRRKNQTTERTETTHSHSLACVVSTSNSEPWELWRCEPADPSEGGWLPEPVEPELEVRASRLAPLGWRPLPAAAAARPGLAGPASCEPPLSLDTIVLGVVVELESDSFSKLPCSFSGRTTRCTSLRVFGLNSNSESRLKLGELRSDWLDEVEPPESCGSASASSLAPGSRMPSGKRSELGGRYTSRGSRFEERFLGATCWW